LNIEIDINELLSSGSTAEPDTASSGPIEVGNAYGMSASRSSTACRCAHRWQCR
jgi:hypothetical protein